MRLLFASYYNGMSAYLMDFGFGGFVGYGGGMPIALVKDELDRYVMSEVRCKT